MRVSQKSLRELPWYFSEDLLEISSRVFQNPLRKSPSNICKDFCFSSRTSLKSRRRFFWNLLKKHGLSEIFVRGALQGFSWKLGGNSQKYLRRFLWNVYMDLSEIFPRLSPEISVRITIKSLQGFPRYFLADFSGKSSKEFRENPFIFQKYLHKFP